MNDRSFASCFAVVMAAALALSAIVPARAENLPPLPRPHLSGPTQADGFSPLNLKLDFPRVQWPYMKIWYVAYLIQFWHCDQGRDVTPTPITLDAHPWAGQTAPCSLSQQIYGIDGQGSQIIYVPRYGAKPQTGSWYVRVRLVWKTESPGHAPQPGPWSDWHRTLVGSRAEDKLSAPHILAPNNMQSFAHRDITIRLASTSKHTNRSRWYFMFEWQRAQYRTSADNAFANPHPEPGGFPRATGIASNFQPWSIYSTFNYLDLGTGSVTLRLKFNYLATGRHDASYIYRFRVREHFKDGNTTGPWSSWRSFIVTDPVTMRRMNTPVIMKRIAHPTLHLKHH